MAYFRCSVNSGGGDIEFTSFENGVVSVNRTQTLTIDTTKTYVLFTCSRYTGTDPRGGLWYIEKGVVTQKLQQGQPTSVTLSGTTLSMVNSSSSVAFEYILVCVE